MSASASARWARIGARSDAEQDGFRRADSSCAVRTPSLGRTPSMSGFRRQSSLRSDVEPQPLLIFRPKIPSGMIQLLSSGHDVSGKKSRFRPRPSTAGAVRTEHAERNHSRIISQPFSDEPDWMTSGPPMSPNSPKTPWQQTGMSPKTQTITQSKRASFLRRNGSMTKLSPESSMLSFLQSIPLLSHIQLERLATLAGHLTSSHEKFGTVLMREGENTENITIIWNGTVSVERKVLNATTCEEARILSSCMRTTAQTKILKLAAGSEDDEAPSRATPSQASLVTGTCGRGVIFGELSVLFGLGTSETVRVESVTGAHILRCPAAAIHECCEDKALAIMKAKVQQVARWRQEQASVISGSMTAAAYHYSTRPETHVAFPSSREIKSINRKARADVWHPLGWRKKLAQQEELERTAAEVAMREKSGKELKKAKRNAPPRRPSSARSACGTLARRRWGGRGCCGPRR